MKKNVLFVFCCFLFSSVYGQAPGPISGGGRFCAGSSLPLTDTSSGGTWSSGTPAVATVDSVTGVVTAVDIEAIAAGTATISYTTPAGSVTTVVTVNPLPIAYDVLGGGHYCAGSSPGVHIGLEWSDTGISYQLYSNDTSAIGAPRAGLNFEMDFGIIGASGNYSVVATDTLTGCAITSYGEDGYVSITIVPTVVPSVTIVPDVIGDICEGTTVSFSYTSTGEGVGPLYQWSLNGAPVPGATAGYSYVPVNGDIVGIRLRSNAECAIPDTAIAAMSMSVVPHSLPVVALSPLPNDTVCEGTAVTITATPGFGGTAPTYLWIKNTLTVDTGGSYSFMPADGDDVYCIMQSNYFCRSATTAYSNVVFMSVKSPASMIPVVSLVALNGTSIAKHHADTLVAHVSNGGSAPVFQWYLNGGMVPGATTSVYVKNSFNNKDSVSCMVTRTDACAMSSFNSVVISVYENEVPGMRLSGSVALYPNPNNGVFTVAGIVPGLANTDMPLVVRNLVGQVIYKQEVNVVDGNINKEVVLGDRLTKGMYLLYLGANGENGIYHFVID